MNRFFKAICAAAISLAMLSVHQPPAARADDENQAPVEIRRKIEKQWGSLGPVYNLAVRFAKKGEYDHAIVLLKSLKRDDDPRVLNYLGFATRKSGKPKDAVPFYKKALSLAPDFVVAREYLGEAWLQLGQPEKANEQLAEIKKYCGRPCLSSQNLSNAINAHAAGEPVTAPGW